MRAIKRMRAHLRCHLARDGVLDGPAGGGGYEIVQPGQVGVRYGDAHARKAQLGSVHRCYLVQANDTTRSMSQSLSLKSAPCSCNPCSCALT